MKSILRAFLGFGGSWGFVGLLAFLGLFPAVVGSAQTITSCQLAQVTQPPADKAICAGVDAGFTVTATGTTSYQWQASSGSGWNNLSDDGVYSGTTTNSLAITAATVSMNATQYQCALINSCGTIYTTPATLVVNASMASVSIIASATTVCSGTRVTFTATPTNGGFSPDYQWKLNGANVGTDEPIYATNILAKGDVVACILTSSETCSVPTAPQNPVVMTVDTIPAVFLMPDTVIAFGQSAPLLAQVTTSVTSYQWTPATDLDYPSAVTPVATPESTTTYSLTVTAANCSASGKVTVIVYKPLKMPAAFTPNGDGNNDLFRIPPSLGVRLGSFAVYNRWGARVFYTTNSTDGWDGTLGGQAQPTETYVWMIVYQDLLTHKLVQAQGTVLLIR